MQLSELTLRQFRNYKHCECQFQHGIHLLIGNNAQGKTNLLEAIHVLALAKSHRTNKDKEMIGWNEEFGIIKGRINKKKRSIPLEIQISGAGKKAKVNHLEQRRLSDYIGVLNIVMFAPEDLDLVKGTPQHRRKFLDMEIGQVSRTYVYHLSQYQHILSQRNALLKDWENRKSNETMIDVFTDQIIEQAIKIVKKRFKFVRDLQKWAHPVHLDISRNTESLVIQYQSTLTFTQQMTDDEMKKEYVDHFSQIREKEVRRGTTLIGPHRDDLLFIVNDKPIQIYGSQGQQRTTALSIKLAEIDFIQEQTKDTPLLLLDDVLSELDDHRRSHLLQAIQGKVQTFVTNTSTEGIDPSLLQDARKYRVENGSITAEK